MKTRQMLFRFRKTNFGMTLVEMMMTVAIIGVVSAVLSTMLLQGVRMFRLNSAQGEVQRDARRILDLIGRNLRQADAYSVYIDRNSLSDPPFSLISFTHINGDDIEYYQDGTNFMQTINGGNAVKFGENIRNLFFITVEGGDDTVVSIGLCVESESYEGRTRALKLSIEKVRIMN
jgi:prepilin-type N-terminal cleavage/methylation domain-containing protein